MLRFLKKRIELELNKVTVPTDEVTVAYKFLRGLNEKRINTKICLKLANKPSWYRNLSLMDLTKKAQCYMKQFNALSNFSTKTPNNPNSSSTSNPSKHDKEKTNNKPYKESTSPPSTEPSDTKPTHNEKVEKCKVT